MRRILFGKREVPQQTLDYTGEVLEKNHIQSLCISSAKAQKDTTSAAPFVLKSPEERPRHLDSIPGILFKKRKPDAHASLTSRLKESKHLRIEKVEEQHALTIRGFWEDTRQPRNHSGVLLTFWRILECRY
jgi:hypothetical protein